MKRVFVFEYLTGGGLDGLDEATARELLPLGQSMRDAMVADLVASAEGFAVGGAVCIEAPTLPVGAHALRRREGESVVQFVAREARRHDLVWLVAPETGGLLAQLRSVVPAERWMGCDAAAIETASSKRATLQRLSEFGVATPLDFRRHATRWVVKPDDGAGGCDTRVHDSLNAARADARQRQRPYAAMALEPWVDGEPFSISLLCSSQGAELLSINRQRIAVDDHGLLSYRGVDVNAVPRFDPRGTALALLAARTAEAIPGLRGFVGIDLVWHAQHGPVAIEVNPRVTCAYVGLGPALQRDLAAELVALHARKEPADVQA